MIPTITASIITLYKFVYFLGRLWDRVDIKGLSITCLIVPYIFLSKSLLETVEETVILPCVAEEKFELDNINKKGSHPVLYKLKPSINSEFIEWFVGISEAESNFLCRARKNEGVVVGFEFVFKITLHIDDRNALEYIKATLGCGRLNTERNVLVFTISQLSDIKNILIPLFEQFPLNSTKHLDYLAFKKAFFMFLNRKTSELNKTDLYSKILELKNSMNVNRVSYVLPAGHNIRITGNYLVGLLEGDGSFYFNKNDITVRVSLVTTTPNKVLLEKIREFLLSHLDEYSGMLGSTTKLFNITDKKIKGDNKPISVLEIYQVDYICNILIPYFDKIQFRTKKYKDYIDFRTLAFLALDGKYLTEKGKELMIKLGDTMNNNRLSTNSNPLTIDMSTKSELDLLIKSKPLIEVDSEGRAMIIHEKKYIRSTYIIKAIFLNGSISYFTNGVSCAKALHVSNNTITQRLNDSKPIKNKEGLVSALTVKRIRAYSPKSSS
jgi:hypothetical protein